MNSEVLLYVPGLDTASVRAMEMNHDASMKIAVWLQKAVCSLVLPICCTLQQYKLCSQENSRSTKYFTYYSGVYLLS